MTGERMELWTNDTLSEFAIMLNSSPVASTSQESKYTTIIDESPYVAGYDSNWSYTLDKWIVFYFSNKYTGFLGSQKRSKQEEFRLEPNSEFYDNEFDTSIPGFIPGLGPIPRYISKPRPGLKCHFCNLKYNTEEERKEHEEFWHHDKLFNG
jgi:hypothetical protein